MPTLVIQLGHCYRKSGATGTSGEQQYATSVANACVNLLHGRGGWTVRRILADDSLSRYAGDAFVAIHCDGSTSSSARGASIGYRNAAGQRFGQAWKRAYAARGWSGGFRPDNYTSALGGYYGTGNALSVGNTRAFIAECGFLTNAQDRALLTAAGGASRVALAIGDALGITTEGNDDVTEDDKDDIARKVWGYMNRDIGVTDDAYKILRTIAANAAEGEFGSDVDVVNQAHIYAIEDKVEALDEKLDQVLSRLPEGS
jgi:hypothetical protein